MITLKLKHLPEYALVFPKNPCRTLAMRWEFHSDTPRKVVWYQLFYLSANSAQTHWLSRITLETLVWAENHKWLVIYYISRFVWQHADYLIVLPSVGEIELFWIVGRNAARTDGEYPLVLALPRVLRNQEALQVDIFSARSWHFHVASSSSADNRVRISDS